MYTALEWIQRLRRLLFYIPLNIRRNKEELERDLQILRVTRWRELVAEKRKWKDIVRQAKAHSGL